MLSDLDYGAFLVYSPRGQEDTSRRSREITLGIKADRAGLLAQLAAELARHLAGSGLEELLGPDVVLVPVPKSAPLYPGALWPARRIADELVRHGLGREVLPCLERVQAVKKSAFQPRGGRPSPQVHADSMRARPRALVLPERVTLIDDVVTKGATLLASASLVRAAFPGSVVRGFALVRTMGLTPEVGAIIAPCRGTIRVVQGEAVREP